MPVVTHAPARGWLSGPPRWLRLCGALAVVLLVAAGVAGVWRLRTPPAEASLRRMSLQALRAVVSEHPGSGRVRYWLARALAAGGDVTGAMAQYREAAALDGGGGRALRAQVHLLVDQGRYEEAELEAQKASPSLNPADDHGVRGALLQARGAYRRALAEWDEAARLNPHDADAWFRQGECRLALGEPAPALSAFRRAVRMDAGEPQYAVALCAALRVEGRLAEAEGAARQALALDPGDWRAHFELANVLRDAGSPTAEASFREALRLEPGAAMARYGLANLLLQTGRPSAAEPEYRRALEDLARGEPLPERVGWEAWSLWVDRWSAVIFNRARALRRLGRVAAADAELLRFRRVTEYRNRVRQLRVVATNQPGNAAARRSLAELHRRAGHSALATMELGRPTPQRTTGTPP